MQKEAKLAARAEKRASARDAKKNAKRKKSRPAVAPPGRHYGKKAVFRNLTKQRDGKNTG